MRVLILGKNGMLGSMVERVMRGTSELEVGGTQAEDASSPDFFDAMGAVEELDAFVLHGTTIINCIGITANHIHADDPASMRRAIRVNSEFPQELARYASARDACVIHMSTDGVFAGNGGSYTEDSPHDCTDAYGKTKSLGEAVSDRVLNIRTSIIGPSPHLKAGIWEWFMNQPEGATVSGFTNQHWTGVTTSQFAELCRELILHDAFDAVRGSTSAIHFVPNLAVTKFELLNIFKQVSGKNVVITPQEAPQTLTRTLKATNTAWQQLFSYDLPMHEAVRAVFTMS